MSWSTSTASGDSTCSASPTMWSARSDPTSHAVDAPTHAAYLEAIDGVAERRCATTGCW